MLERLKEYKELLAILVFFLGGFFWIQNRYPTKSDLRAEIQVLDCLLDKYMLLTQLQIRGRDLERLVQSLSAQVALYDDDEDATRPPMSPAMRQERAARQEELDETRRLLKTNLADIEKLRDELQRSVCRGGVS